MSYIFLNKAFSNLFEQQSCNLTGFSHITKYINVKNTLNQAFQVKIYFEII